MRPGKIVKPLKILFDFDGTVCNVESIPYVASVLHIGQWEEIKSITSTSCLSEKGYEDNLRRRIEMMRGVAVKDFVDNLTIETLRPMTADFIRRNPRLCEIATCNLDCWCTPLISSLGIPANTSKSIVEGNYVVGVEYILDKRKLVVRYQNDGYYIVFVGDSANDIAAMNQADMAILFGHNPQLRASLKEGAVSVDSDEELVKSLETLLRKFHQS